MRHLITILLFFNGLPSLSQGFGLPGSHKQDQQQSERKNEKPGAKNDMHAAPNRLKKIKEIKTAYITKKLDLTAEQSGKFWPLYNKYQEEMFAIQAQIRMNNSPSQSNGKDQVLNELSLDEKKNNIKRHYATEFLKILPPEKVSLIYKSEKEFQDEVIKQMRERRNEADN
ncbi:hypothetical protein [Mucilaginibacter paludis]|nr:hypothetical protein [Mucilaginibacter paludis]